MREILPLIPRPSHYLGCEPGSVCKDPSAVRARIALAFPDLYEVGMSYTGQALLYHAVNRVPHLWAERVFAPSKEAAAVMREKGVSLCSLESDTPLAALDAVGFHLTHELCYTNVLYMLDLAGLPLKAVERLQAPMGRFPVIMGGGGCAFNAEPLAPFLDLMVLGDGEEILPELLEDIAGARERGCSLEAFLREQAGKPGIYVPGFFEPREEGGVRPLVKGYEQVEKRLAMDLDALPYPDCPPQPFGAVHDRFTLEIARGCTRGCRFCHAGMVYRPVRERSLERLDEIMSQGLAASGYGELSFLALSAGDFSTLSGLFAQSVARCRAEQVSISLPSLRVGSVSGEIMEQIAGIRRTGATLAPEAGSQRLRDVINKGVSEEGLMQHAAMLFEHGWRGVKLYFMIGLPTETPEDLDAIVELCLKVERLALESGAKNRLQVTAAISPFVPKPHTPFQWEQQIGLEETRKRIGYLKERFRRHKRLKLRWHTPEMSWLEGIFARGDRSLAPVLENAWRRGALFSSWNDHLDITTWIQALEACGFDHEAREAWLGARNLDAPLPWDHLSSGVARRFLRSELKNALHEAGGRLTPDCRFGACRGCGVCSISAMPSLLTQQARSMDIRPKTNLDARDQREGQEATGVAPGQQPSLPHIQQRNLHHKAQHLRIWYARHGAASFLSQLELQAIFERAMRRARLELTFSQGYHPLPLMSFGRALPVGVASECEYFDLFLRTAVPPDEFCSLLQPGLPEGLCCTEVRTLPLHGKQPQSVAEEFELCRQGDAQELQAFHDAWRAFEQLEHYAWSRETRKGLRTRDIRPLFATIEWKATGEVRLLFDWREVYINPLAMCLEILKEQEPHKLSLRKVAQFFPGDVAEKDILG